MATNPRNSGANTTVNRDYFVDVNLRYYQIFFPNQNFTSEQALSGGASELVVQLLKPVAYRFDIQAPHTYMYALIEGADGADNDMSGLNTLREPTALIENKIRGLGNAVGPNNKDLTLTEVYIKALK